MNGGPTIPAAIWQALLTILGAAIGAIVADRITRRGERRRDLKAAAYEFEIIVSKLLFLVEKERHDLQSLIRNNFSELERAVYKVRFFIQGDCRTAFDAEWKRYASIQHGQLKADSVRQTETGSMIQDYTNACKIMSEPLGAMLQIVRRMAQ